MGELFWNKIIGAVLATFLTVFALTEISHMLIHPHELEAPAYPIEVPEDATGGAAEAAPVDVGLMLREASADSGENLAGTLCGSCHTFNEGGAESTGPNLYNVVGRVAGAHPGFGFSGAMTDFGEEWTYENLWAYLERPSGLVPGTAMTFAGLRREGQRADIIAYLATLSPDPAPFPEPLPDEPAAEEDAEVAEAEGEAAGAQNADAQESGAAAAGDEEAAPGENAIGATTPELEERQVEVEGAADETVPPDVVEETPGTETVEPEQVPTP